MVDASGQTQYTYDVNSRLDSTTYPGIGLVDYNYDWVGNRVNPPANPNGLVFNAADQLVTWPAQHTYDYYGTGSLRRMYDSLGQTVQKTFTYTPANLLESVTHDSVQGTPVSSMTWDADSNRVSFTSSTGGTWTFVYDTTAGIPAVIEEVTPSGSANYIREPNGGLIARVAGGSVQYYHFDALGSTRLLTDADGDVTDTYSYDAWGNCTHNGETAQPYQYVGQLGYYTHVQDENLPLLQLGVRFYEPEAGRFTQGDRVRRDRYSSYPYANDRPSALVDSSGGSPLVGVIAGAAVAGAGAAAYHCVMEALDKAEDMHARNDKLAHCYMACRTTRCLGGGLCQSYFVPWFMSREEADPDDSEANRRGGACARDQWKWPFNDYPDCYTCCKAKIRDLPNNPGRLR